MERAVGDDDEAGGHRFVTVPKRTGGTRTLTLLGPMDDARYRRVVERLVAAGAQELG